MELSRERHEKLAQVARLYYFEDKKQIDIANELGISRPMVSRMLSEAMENGVVEIIIHSPQEAADLVLQRFCEAGGLKDCILVEDSPDTNVTRSNLARGCADLLAKLETRRLGIGWGDVLCRLAAGSEQDSVSQAQTMSHLSEICPLIGNGCSPDQEFQSDELVRLLACQSGAVPRFLCLPALPSDAQERKFWLVSSLWERVSIQWEQLDTVLVNLASYPSPGDCRQPAAREDMALIEGSCGVLLMYHFTEDGMILDADSPRAMQIPLDVLRRCPRVVGVCSPDLTPKALHGALKTGLFTHIVVRETLAREFLARKE